MLSEGLIRVVFISHVAATWLMIGLVWFVQVVHYPLFGEVGSSKFVTYEQRHTSRTSWVVGPPMLVEAATSVLLLWRRPPGIPLWQVWLGAALLAGVWLSTALLQVPCHSLLSKRFDVAALKHLVATNWIRTTAWSARGILVLSMLWYIWPAYQPQ